MESLSEASRSRLDTLRLIAAVVLISGAMFAFYYLDHRLLLLGRLALLAVGAAAGIAVGYQTTIGRYVWGIIIGSRIELRKVVWPTRQQSIQVTLLVAVVVLLTALFLWLVDSTLLFAIKHLTGGSLQ